MNRHDRPLTRIQVTHLSKPLELQTEVDIAQDQLFVKLAEAFSFKAFSGYENLYCRFDDPANELINYTFFTPPENGVKPDVAEIQAAKKGIFGYDKILRALEGNQEEAAKTVERLFDVASAVIQVLRKSVKEDRVTASPDTLLAQTRGKGFEADIDSASPLKKTYLSTLLDVEGLHKKLTGLGLLGEGSHPPAGLELIQKLVEAKIPELADNLEQEVTSRGFSLGTV